MVGWRGAISHKHFEGQGIAAKALAGQYKQVIDIDKAMRTMHGRPVALEIDMSVIQYFPGQPSYDVACGCLHYVGALLTKTSKDKVIELRDELGAKPNNFVPHVSFAGVAPVRHAADKPITEWEWMQFRSVWAESHPLKGMPKPFNRLCANSALERRLTEQAPSARLVPYSRR